MINLTQDQVQPPFLFGHFSARIHLASTRIFV